MLNKINDLMYGSMFMANVFIMLLGCVEEYKPTTIIVLCSGLVISVISCLIFRLVKQICLTTKTYNRRTEHKHNKVA